MYKKFFMGIAAMAALTLVSCSSDDLNSLSDNSSKNEAISFDGYLGRSAVAVNGSRGSVLTIDNLQTDGFGVFGNYTTGGQNFGSNLFNNVKVTGKTSTGVTKWTYGPVKYWPSNGHIDFLAYAPHVEGKKLKDNTSCIDFTVEPKVADQKDLLWANAKKQTIQTIASTENKVKFHFAHALSRLGFTVKLKGESSTDATITLKKITLAGSASATESTPGAFYTSGAIDLAAGSWDKTTLNNKQNLDWFSGSQKVTSTSQSNTDFNTGYLFVIPQEFSGANELYVIVEYDIKYNDITETMTNTVHHKLTQDFKQGKAYTINLTIGRPIEFDADVTPWVDGSNKNTDINIDSWE
nr:fimbrillin family protein [uncultured Prevotella sp.]